MGEDGLKVHSTVEAESTVGENIDPVTLVITGCVDDGYLLLKVSLNRSLLRTYHDEVVTYIPTLDEVPSDEQILLVRRDLDIVRSDDGLGLVRVVETLDVVEVRDVEGCHVVAQRQGEVGELAVVGEV